MKHTLLSLLRITTLCLLVGCSQVNQTDLDQARADARQAKAEVEELRGRLDSIAPKNAKSAQESTSTATPGKNSNNPAPSIPRFDRTNPSALQPGKIELRIKLGDTRLSSKAGPWLYVDGRLVRDLGVNPFPGGEQPLLTLVPGEYLLEVVCAGFLQDASGDEARLLEFGDRARVGYPSSVEHREPFWLLVREQRVKVQANETIIASFDFPPLYEPFPRNVRFGPYAFLLRGASVPGWSQAWHAKAEHKMKLYELDSVAEAIRQLDRQLGSRKPEKRVAMLEIPELYGGRREVNAAQVRWIVGWLKEHYWGDWPNGFVTIATEKYQDDFNLEFEAIQRLQQVVVRHKERIDQLAALARKLEMGAE